VALTHCAKCIELVKKASVWCICCWAGRATFVLV